MATLLCHRLPYNIVDFRRLVEVATGNRDVTILSCDTFNDMLSSSFARFCEMVVRLLDIEFRLKFKMPFLNLIHDLWTTGTGKKGVIGTSISFIDSNRDFRHFAMLVRILNDFHESKLVKEMIMSRIAELYGVTIDGMAQFLMSDTAPSARKVSKLFDDAIPVDCTIATENIYLAEIDAVIEEDRRMLRDAHRDVFRAMYSGAQDASVRATTEMPPYLHLVPSIDDNGILCGTLVAMSDVRERPLRCRHDDADEVLAKSLNHGCKWPCSSHWAIS
ncbi:hypothetical protein GQ600_18839 [Phytophthora cactorum]|nr:hypothetical protein GQ600_18839 [Phytophthora cactorum]